MNTTPHSLLGPDELGPASGFSHGVLAAEGKLLHVAGQVGSDASGVIVARGIAAQLGVALGRVVRVLAAAGGRPEDVVSMVLYTTAMPEYREQRSEIGAVYRAHFGRHFPAMTMVAVAELVDPEALIEVAAVAVIADRRPSTPR